jgi:hypothetical protein
MTNNNGVVDEVVRMNKVMTSHSMKKTGSSPTSTPFNFDGALFGHGRPKGPKHNVL